MVILVEYPTTSYSFMMGRRMLLGGFGGEPLVALLGDRHSDSFALRKRDPWLGSFADREDVIQSGGKGMSGGVLDVDNVERPGMPFPVHDDADTPQVTTSGHHANVSRLKLDGVGDLASFDIDLHAVLSADQRIRISDCASIGSGKVRNSLGSDRHFLDDAKLVSGFFLGNTVDLVSSFDVVDESKILPALLHLDDVHKSGWVSVVRTNSTVHFDQSLGEDLLDFGVGQSVLEAIPQEERQGKALAQLVRPGRRAGSVASSQFVEHPVSGRRNALHVLTGTANHFEILSGFLI